MKAVILAGGNGRRMGELSKNVPKVMIELKGKPILEWILDSLVGKVSEAIIVVGYKKEAIMNYFKDKYKGLKIRYVVQKEQLGTAHALGLVKNLISSRFLLIYGDLHYDPKIIDKVLTNPCAGVIVVKEEQNPRDYGVIELIDGRVKKIHEKVSNPPSNLINAGIYLLPVEIFDAIEKTRPSSRGEYELTESIQHLIDKGYYFGIIKVKKWVDVGTPERLVLASRLSF